MRLRSTVLMLTGMTSLLSLTSIDSALANNQQLEQQGKACLSQLNLTSAQKAQLDSIDRTAKSPEERKRKALLVFTTSQRMQLIRCVML